MEIRKIREMNDAELEKYLRGLTRRGKMNCVKCGKTNSNYTINVQNRRIFQQKKLCSLCDSCYVELLEHLETCDIIWD